MPPHSLDFHQDSGSFYNLEKKVSRLSDSSLLLRSAFVRVEKCVPILHLTKLPGTKPRISVRKKVIKKKEKRKKNFEEDELSTHFSFRTYEDGKHSPFLIFTRQKVKCVYVQSRINSFKQEKINANS